ARSRFTGALGAGELSKSLLLCLGVPRLRRVPTSGAVRPGFRPRPPCQFRASRPPMSPALPLDPFACVLVPEDPRRQAPGTHLPVPVMGLPVRSRPLQGAGPAVELVADGHQPVAPAGPAGSPEVNPAVVR